MNDLLGSSLRARDACARGAGLGQRRGPGATTATARANAIVGMNGFGMVVGFSLGFAWVRVGSTGSVFG
jgi:hypothetical protein